MVRVTNRFLIVSLVAQSLEACECQNLGVTAEFINSWSSKLPSHGTHPTHTQQLFRSRLWLRLCRSRSWGWWEPQRQTATDKFVGARTRPHPGITTTTPDWNLTHRQASSLHLLFSVISIQNWIEQIKQIFFPSCVHDHIAVSSHFMVLRISL